MKGYAWDIREDPDALDRFLLSDEGGHRVDGPLDVGRLTHAVLVMRSLAIWAGKRLPDEYRPSFEIWRELMVLGYDRGGPVRPLLHSDWEPSQ